MDKGTEYDRLDKMLALQKEFHELVGPSLKSASEAQSELMVADSMRNLIVECVEVMQSVNWKPWRKKRFDVDWPHEKEELYDCFIFLMNALLESGVDSEAFFQGVIRKIRKNIERQKNGY